MPPGTVAFFWQHSSEASLQVDDLLVLVLKANNIPDVRISIVVKIMMNFFFMVLVLIPVFGEWLMVLTTHKPNMLQQT